MTVPPAAHPDDLEQRLVRLEELAVFQDQTIAQLDEALARQQAQLDAREKQIERLEARMRILWLHFVPVTVGGRREISAKPAWIRRGARGFLWPGIPC